MAVKSKKLGLKFNLTLILILPVQYVLHSVVSTIASGSFVKRTRRVASVQPSEVEARLNNI
jgi:hypothetical protein